VSCRVSIDACGGDEYVATNVQTTHALTARHRCGGEGHVLTRTATRTPQRTCTEKRLAMGRPCADASATSPLAIAGRSHNPASGIAILEMSRICRQGTQQQQQRRRRRRRRRRRTHAQVINTAAVDRCTGSSRRGDQLPPKQKQGGANSAQRKRVVWSPPHSLTLSEMDP
jgi:hypothetical protein